MSQSLRLPGPLRAALRPLRGMPRCRLTGEPQRIAQEGAWAVPLKLRAQEATEFIPLESSWFLLVDFEYPLGQVRLYPASKSGITRTFPHQDLNRPQKDAKWRTGKLCLDSPVGRLGAVAAGPEPIGNPDGRVSWHMRRALAWLDAASAGKLLKDGDPFELPACPSAKAPGRVAHDESLGEFACWQNCDVDVGLVALVANHPQGSRAMWAASFRTFKGAVIRESWSGSTFASTGLGLWWRWPEPIVVPPWQMPVTWRGLGVAAQRQGLDYFGTMRRLLSRARRHDSQLLLIGFPIPKVYGQDSVEMHWQALTLPDTSIEAKPPRGFRKNNTGRSARLKRRLNSKKPVPYVSTKNWHPDRLQARGRYPASLRESRVAIIGVGALGSAVADLLARGGVKKLLFVDHDTLVAGNLVRHQLTFDDVGHKKVSAVAKRCRSVSPNCEVRVHDKRLPNRRDRLEDLLDEYEVVIDCTASDEVIHALSNGWWSIPRLFVSASVGYRARRVFLFVHHGNCFPKDSFAQQMEPLLREERREWAKDGELLEGAGCWSPLFPAQLDNIWLAAVSTAKAVKNGCESRPADRSLMVYEVADDGGFTGIRRLEEHEI